MTGAESKSQRDRITREILSKAYDVVNGDDYNPESIYEDLEYDPQMRLPWESSLAPETSISPRLNPRQEFRSTIVDVSTRPVSRPKKENVENNEEAAPQTQRPVQDMVSIR